MNIVIHNYLSGSFLLERDPNVWDAIVILDRGLAHTDFVNRHARRHLYLWFDDVERSMAGKRAPTSDDIRLALDFAANSQNLMVCCRAGQSRSAATAFLISFQKLGSEAAWGLLNPKRHIPNSLIVELGARLLDDPSVLAVLREWKTENRNVKLSDHLEDIEREFDELECAGARNRIVDS